MAAKKASKSRKSAYDKNFVGVTQKVFALLEALSQQPKPGVPLDELTNLSGLPKTTVHRLLYSMNKLGYIEQDPVTNLYLLSGKFFELGANALPYQRLTVVAKPLMQNLMLTFGESVNLAVLTPSGSLIYILVLESPRAHRVAAAVGTYSHFHCTSVGKSIAAYFSKEELAEHLGRYGMPAMTSSSITSMDDLDPELARVRSDGFAIDNEENLPGIICVGGPIFSSAAKPVAAMSISGPSVRISEHLPAIKQAIRDTVRTISTLLGDLACGKGGAAAAMRRLQPSSTLRFDPAGR